MNRFTMTEKQERALAELVVRMAFSATIDAYKAGLPAQMSDRVKERLALKIVKSAKPAIDALNERYGILK